MGDSILWLRAQEALCDLNGDIRQSKVFAQEASDQSGETLVRSKSHLLQDAEDSVSNEAHDSKLWKLIRLLIAGALLLIILIVAGSRIRALLTRRKMNQDVEQMRQVVRDMEMRRRHIEEERNQLASKMEQSHDMMNRQQEALNQVMGELDDSRQRISEQQHQLSNLHAQMEGLQQQIDQMQLTNDELIEDLLRQKENASGVETHNRQLQELITSLRQQMHEMESSLVQARLQVKEQENAREAAHVRVRQQVDELKSRETSLHEQEQTELVKSLALSTLINRLGRALESLINGYNSAYREKRFDNRVFSDLVLTPEFFNVLRRYVDASHSNLATDMTARQDITEKEVNVICMHLCGISNGFIRIYTKQMNNHSVTNLKDIVAKKFFGEGGSIKDFSDY